MISNKMDEKFEMMSDRVNDSIESQANAKKAVEQKPVFKVVTSAAGQVIGHATAGTRGHPPHTATDRAEKTKLSTTDRSAYKTLIHAVPGILGVKGSLKRHSNWWHKHETNSFILSVIDNGYELPFAEMPKPSVNKRC